MTRQRQCKICKAIYTPLRPLQSVCGVTCAIALGNQKSVKKALKAQKQHDRKWKVGNRTISEWTKRVQVEFNKWVRSRDAHLPCVSCGTTNPRHTGKGGAWDCGHYMSRGSHPELRFTEDNAARQCKKCNSFGSGRHPEFRLELIKRIGQDRVDWLEGPHEPKQYRREELEELLAKYKAKNKEFRSNTLAQTTY